MTTQYGVDFSPNGFANILKIDDGRCFRYTLAPGSDVTGLSDDIATACQRTWTDDIIAAYRNACTADDPV